MENSLINFLPLLLFIRFSISTSHKSIFLRISKFSFTNLYAFFITFSLFFLFNKYSIPSSHSCSLYAIIPFILFCMILSYGPSFVENPCAITAMFKVASSKYLQLLLYLLNSLSLRGISAISKFNEFNLSGYF